MTRLTDAALQRAGRRLVSAVPLAWMLLLFAVPIFIILKIAFAEIELGIPPYTPLASWDAENGALQIRLSLANFMALAADDLYLRAYLNSVETAAVSTVICLLLGYPMAYAIARARPAWRGPLLMLVILPFWTSFLIRVYAWMGILKDNGLLNNLLLSLGVVDEPLTLLYTPGAVYLGITYSYLPFMVLPLYTALEKMDLSLLEAASDLGARPWKAFLTVTLPLSLPGVLAGSLLVFIPAVGEYVIPELLGGPNVLMIGRVLWNDFFNARDWPLASAMAVVLLVLLVVPIMLFQRAQGRQQEGR